MMLQYLSIGASDRRNDDHVAVFATAGVTDILVIDGGSSVAQRDYIDPVQGDVSWFVHAFTAALERVLAPGRSQQDCVLDAIDIVQAEFDRITTGSATELPLYAWPIAALTWARIETVDTTARLTLYSLGDCKTLLGTASDAVIDLDPFINPQDGVLQAEIARLRAAGVNDAEQRRVHMLPMLRARREFQNTAPAPTILCVRPNGAFQARISTRTLDAGAKLLVMTDGFYRLVDPYGLYDDALLMKACAERGLAPMVDALRAYEAVSNTTGTQAVKAADDASATMWVAS